MALDPANPVSQFVRDYPFVLPLVTMTFSLWAGRKWATSDLKKAARNIFSEDLKSFKSKLGMLTGSLLTNSSMNRDQIRMWLQAFDTDVDALNNKYLDLLGPKQSKKIDSSHSTGNVVAKFGKFTLVRNADSLTNQSPPD